MALSVQGSLPLASPLFATCQLDNDTKRIGWSSKRWEMKPQSFCWKQQQTFFGNCFWNHKTRNNQKHKKNVADNLSDPPPVQLSWRWTRQLRPGTSKNPVEFDGTPLEIFSTCFCDKSDGFDRWMVRSAAPPSPEWCKATRADLIKVGDLSGCGPNLFILHDYRYRCGGHLMYDHSIPQPFLCCSECLVY